jgi:hypothetical protein
VSQKPADIANQALDACGLSEFVIGDLEEGTFPAQVMLRNYWTCLRALLRGANWDFARTQAPLLLLADASGQTPGVGNVVPQGQFQYEYAYPVDCARVRFIPWQPFLNPGAPTGNIAPPNASAPIMTGLNVSPLQGQRIRPARFVISSDPNYPAPGGSQTNLIQGQSPEGNTVILTNVPNAQVIYTAYKLYPSVWDMLFRSAMVAYLASEVAFPLWVKLKTDPKMGLQLRKENIALLKAKVTEARLVDGNEGVASNDIRVDWISTRRSGGGMTGWQGGSNDWGPGGYGGGWDSMGLADGSVF